MEYWEFNFYLLGYKEKYYVDEVNMMKLAYNTGMFSHETKHKPKSLESYVDKIDRAYHKGKYRDVPVDIEKSRNIYDKIEELKKGSDGNWKIEK